MRLGGLGLADPRRAFEQQGLAERQGQIGGRRQALVGKILRGLERLFQRLRAVDADDAAPDGH